MSEWPNHYRLHDALFADGVHVSVETFKVIKETPRGYWVVNSYAPAWLTPDELRKRKFAKWVSKTSRRRLCYPTLELAIDSYRHRKTSQVARLKTQLEQAEKVLEQFSVIKETPARYFLLGHSVVLGRIPSNDYLEFDY